MVERSHTISTAAAEIVALINSRSQSPWPHEFEAIIARVARPMAGVSPHLPSSLSPDHLRYRQLVAEIDGFEWGEGLEDEKEREPAFDKLTEQATELEAQVWATPAKTLADVLLRGEVALHNENGVMESLEDAKAYYDERAVAQLIKAVVDVLGGLHAR
jgi:hypothetical protein